MLLGRALALAADVHANQLDKGGHAYFLHPIRVMQRLRTQDEELMQIAVLHDCVEDSKGSVTIDRLREMGFTKRVTDALALLTHDHDDSYEDYIKRIASSRDATRVKLEDLRDNTDVTRLKGLRPKDFERMAKYHRAFLFLSTTLETMASVGY